MAVSYSLAIDAPNQPDDITVDTQAPNANDVELRISLANTPTRHQVELILEAFRRRLDGVYGTSDLASI